MWMLQWTAMWTGPAIFEVSDVAYEEGMENDSKYKMLVESSGFTLTICGSRWRIDA